MKLITLLFIFVLGIFNVNAQIINPAEKLALPSTLSESSGAIFFNGKLITHNDSGGENKLYELDTISGQITRTVTITNATNVDWEDITQDDTYIYIGDIGNNVSGNRTDLKIYKLSKNDYLSSTSVTAETIAFSYANQTNFTASSPNTTEWDAEALVSFDATHLIIFSKNWVNNNTKAYLVPKSPGSYQLTPLAASLNSGGLITGGTYNPFTGKLYLIGYTSFLQPFIWVCANFNGNNVFSGTNTQTSLSSFGFEQVEAITFVNENRYFVTSESFSQSFISDYAKLMSFSTNDASLSIRLIDTPEDVFLYPNPVINSLTIQNPEVILVEIYDSKLSQLHSSTNKTIDMSPFSKGIYLIKMTTNTGQVIVKKIVKN
ncbi:T9SS type A sorting domain-containing protein [Mariniflexile gromovii]|uniref:T9SS type A sorting domain-containing protein n=1 Tax=Mariniflexile gromovii TaxID=362523 RepID=A0ABS4BQR8_9FLAO|nr:T9SS type A sorting domain-containing protein [Mariniflexile gromovii]MBP0902928.1 T9SS type A sorting domain-containing protein [Mariniflexile gromovii]